MKLIAHRSGPVLHPEQTVASALHAASQGADLIELDVRLTVDNQLVICHDANAARIFDRHAAIHDMTAAEFLSLQRIDAPQARPHLFTDYLEQVSIPLLIHVKHPSNITEQGDALDELLRVVDRYGCRDRVVLGITTPDHAKRIQQHDPKISILSFGSKERIPEFLELHVPYIRLWQNWLDWETVDLIHAGGADLWVMSGTPGEETVGKPTDRELEKILSYHPEGILIDDITRLR